MTTCGSLQHQKASSLLLSSISKEAAVKTTEKQRAITQGYHNSAQETLNPSTYTSSKCICTDPSCITASVREFTTYAQVKWAVWGPSSGIWQTTCYLPVQSSVHSLSSPLGMQQNFLQDLLLWLFTGWCSFPTGSWEGEWPTRAHSCWNDLPGGSSKHMRSAGKRGDQRQIFIYYIGAKQLPLSISLSQAKHGNSVYQQIYIVQ